MYSSLNGIIETVSTNVKVLDTQLAQIASKSRAPLGVVPVKSEDNPREQVNMIELGSWFLLGETYQYWFVTSQNTPILSTDRCDDIIRKYRCPDLIL